MLVGEVMSIVELAMRHVHVAASGGPTEHHTRLLARIQAAVAVRRIAPVLVQTFHKHAADTDVVLPGNMPCESGTGEEVVALVTGCTVIVLIQAGAGILLLAVGVALVVAMAEPDVGIGVPF